MYLNRFGNWQVKDTGADAPTGYCVEDPNNKGYFLAKTENMSGWGSRYGGSDNDRCYRQDGALHETTKYNEEPCIGGFGKAQCLSACDAKSVNCNDGATAKARYYLLADGATGTPVKDNGFISSSVSAAVDVTSTAIDAAVDVTNAAIDAAVDVTNITVDAAINGGTAVDVTNTAVNAAVDVTNTAVNGAIDLTNAAINLVTAPVKDNGFISNSVNTAVDATA